MNKTNPKASMGGRLEWTQPSKDRRSFELLSNGERLATLTFIKPWGTLAECKMEGEAYTFKRTGFLRPKVTVRRSPFDEDIATMEVSLGGEGALEMLDGKRYTFHRLSFWKARWGLTNEAGDLLVSMRLHNKLLRFEGEAVLEDKGRKEGKMVLLMSLGWYLMVLMTQESTAAAGTAGASS